MSGLLYNRSSYTLMNSTLTIGQLVSFAVEQGYEAIGLTDRDVCHGYMELFHATKNSPVKPVYGLETMLLIEGEQYPFLLFAKNIRGYQKLLEISTSVNVLKNVFKFEEIMEIDDLAIVEIDKGSQLEHLINFENEESIIRHLDERSGCRNYYLGLSSPTNGKNYYRQLSTSLYAYARKCGVRCLAIPLALYAGQEDFDAYKALSAIREQTSIYDERLKIQTNAALLAKSELESGYDQDIINDLNHFISECNTDVSDIEKAKLPEFQCPDAVDSFTYLRGLCFAGLKKRFSDRSIDESYHQRLSYELKVIESMGFSDYFLIVWDVVKYARNQGIYVGVGRGSVTGCLAAYCLGITHIDPLKYSLLFERFLNPERISMPDIDIDFPDDKRHLVLEYLKNKYHEDHIAHILTFGTFGVRQLLRDLGKALNIPSSTINIICNTVGSSPFITLNGSYRNNERFRKAINSSDEVRYLFRLAAVLENLPRHYSTHAAGIVFSDRPLAVNCPYFALNDDLFTSQFTMEYLEELGLIKIDFLSLRNLTTIANIVDIVNDTEPLDILHIPLDDKKTYELLAQAKTTGIFQLESDGMKNLLRKMKPYCFEDIIAAIALFRPGPMENIPAYLQARSDHSQIHYSVRELEPVLKSTYGIMVYQEQVMQVAQIIAGFSLGKADILRKAVSKKDPEVLLSLRADFISGARAKGFSGSTAEDIYASIEKFGNYGFNKSHSVAYSLLAYQLAYLKANYPQAFYLSLLNSVINDETKANEYIVECRNAGIRILPPDVNMSSAVYQIENADIRFPLTSIKGVGNVVAKRIVEERQKNGIYEDFFAFVARNYKSVNRNMIEILIKSGCLDSFGFSRNTMLKGLPESLRYADLISFSKNGQISIDFDLVSKPILADYIDSANENSRNEMALIGFYINGHPCENYRKNYPDSIISNIAKTKRGRVKVIVRIHKLREHRTRNGELMCFAEGYDEMGDLSLAFMPNIYRQYAEQLKKFIIIVAEGTVDDRESVKVSKMTVLEGD